MYLLLECKEVEETQNKKMPSIKVSHAMEERNHMGPHTYTENERQRP